MAISKEKQEYFVEQIEALTGKRPLFYLKFCSQEKYAEDVCNGKLYANTVEYFRRRELETGERGQGDQFELLLSIKTENITAVDSKTGDILFTAPKGMFNVQFKSDDDLLIVSFTGIPLGDMVFVNADEHHAEFLFPFTDGEYDTMKERFGEYCVIIGARELESKITSYSLKNNADYVFDKIEYCDQNRIDRIQAFNKSAKERFLYKNADLGCQKE